MFLALERQHPRWRSHIRVTDFTQPIDLFSAEGFFTRDGDAGADGRFWGRF